ncbi:MAG: YraN family protein [Deltaproteobacteria bacterium]|nr:YraN family protein [Deltaproteobacteria bacterium]
MFVGSTKNKGMRGEELARLHLKKDGYKILESNFNTRIGEIDIVAKDHDFLVFVEVKIASSSRFGNPLGWIPEWKQRRIIKVSQVYIKNRGAYNRPVRFDVVAIEESGRICHIKDAFRPRGEVFV